MPKNYLQLLKYLARWVPIASLAGILAGSASALLLVSLAWATAFREGHRWIIFLLPLAGVLVGCLYYYFGQSVDAGNNLILDEIHAETEDPRRIIPFRMTPLILVGTFLTHVFGGSAGREGTAVQTGASLADQLARPFRLGYADRRVLLMAGISAGFGSVFGTPLAGAVFGLEVLTLGSISYEAIVPCFLAAFVGDLTTRGWGIQHSVNRALDVPPLHVSGLVYAALAGVVFGLVALLFARSMHGVSRLFRKHIKWPPLRPFIGGIVVAAAVFALGTTKYIGLGIPTTDLAFTGHSEPYDWLLKLAFTVLTIGSGFKGGEVTPMFFIGATLGNALAWVLPLSPSLLAAMGFVAVFAGASNTPLASALMAMELFGTEAGSYAAIACVFSYLFSGHSGIYGSQRVLARKHGFISAPDAARRETDSVQGR